jgi:hypothetical protein
VEIAGVRLTWKARGEDTGYAMSFYEMDLPAGKGIPLHSHPYAEIFMSSQDTLISYVWMLTGKKSGCAAVREILWWLQ